MSVPKEMLKKAGEGSKTEYVVVKGYVYHDAHGTGFSEGQHVKCTEKEYDMQKWKLKAVCVEPVVAVDPGGDSQTVVTPVQTEETSKPGQDSSNPFDELE